MSDGDATKTTAAASEGAEPPARRSRRTFDAVRAIRDRLAAGLASPDPEAEVRGLLDAFDRLQERTRHAQDGCRRFPDAAAPERDVAETVIEARTGAHEADAARDPFRWPPPIEVSDYVVRELAREATVAEVGVALQRARQWCRAVLARMAQRDGARPEHADWLMWSVQSRLALALQDALATLPRSLDRLLTLARRRDLGAEGLLDCCADWLEEGGHRPPPPAARPTRTALRSVAPWLTDAQVVSLQAFWTPDPKAPAQATQAYPHCATCRDRLTEDA